MKESEMAEEAPKPGKFAEILCSAGFHKAALAVRSAAMLFLGFSLAMNWSLGIGKFWLIALLMYLFFRLNETIKIRMRQEALRKTEPDDESREFLVSDYLDGDVKMVIFAAIATTSLILLFLVTVLAGVRKMASCGERDISTRDVTEDEQTGS